MTVPIESLSQPGKPCYRPEVAATPAGVWVFWDCYGGLNYSVYGRRVSPALGAVEQLSTNSNSMDARARYGSNSGLVVAWVAERDVSGKGALDQWHFVDAASMTNGSWTRSRRIADLGHGLLSRLEPEVGPIWGYAGKRLNPMLVEDDGDVWMLWERKVQHDGRSTVPGELSGRRFDGKNWQPPKVSHRNLVQYQVPSSGSAVDGKLLIAGSDTMHHLTTLSVNLRAVSDPPQSTELTGWTPAELPLPHWTPLERPFAMIDGRKVPKLECELSGLLTVIWSDRSTGPGIGFVGRSHAGFVASCNLSIRSGSY